MNVILILIRKRKKTQTKFESFTIPNVKKNHKETVNGKIKNKLTPVKTVISLIEDYKDNNDKDKCKKIIDTIMSMKDELQSSVDELVKITK